MSRIRGEPPGTNLVKANAELRRLSKIDIDGSHKSSIHVEDRTYHQIVSDRAAFRGRVAAKKSCTY